MIDPLTRRFGQNPECDVAVAFILGRMADPAAVEALLKIENTAASKEIKREARAERKQPHAS